MKKICPRCKMPIEFEIKNVKDDRYLCCYYCGKCDIENPYFEE